MRPDGLARLRNAKTALQQRLSRTIARTERLSASKMRGGMLLDAPLAEGALHATDIRAFLGAQSIADAVDEGDVVEYWKSAPYLFTFMDNYALSCAANRGFQRK